MPTVEDMKLSIERFTGKEEYRELGAGFKDWGLQFLAAVGAAQQLSGGEWPEEFKMRTLNRYLDGIARLTRRVHLLAREKMARMRLNYYQLVMLARLSKSRSKCASQ